MAATIFNDGKFQAIDNSGNIVPYGKVYFIDAVTGSPVQTYSDAKMTITNPHPVVLSASGKADIFLGDATYDITLKDKNGATIWTINNFIPTTGNGTLIPAVVIPTKEEFTNISGSTIILANTPLTTVDIYKNGLMLNTDEYSLDANTIVLTTPLIASDEIVVEFTKVIDSAFNPAIAYPYDTLNDLISSSIIYRKVWVSGYHTKGDGAFGSHIFEWDDTSTETDNGGTIIKLANVDTGRYKLKYDGAINVKWFGAVGDGVADDTSSIQSAIDFCRTLKDTTFYDGVNPTATYHFSWKVKFVFPPDNSFRLTKSLNMTKLSFAHSWLYIEAKGAIIMLDANGTELAGKAGIDLLGSRKIYWEGGTIISNGFSSEISSKICKIGMQIGRGIGNTGNDNDSEFGDSCFFSALEVKGYYSLSCLYNYAAEDLYSEHLALKNDWDNSDAYCLIQDGTNYWNITSEYIQTSAQNTPRSFLRNVFMRLDARKTNQGGALWINGQANSHEFKSSYLVAFEDHAVKLMATDNGTGVVNHKFENFIFDIHIEYDGNDLDPNTGLDYAFVLDSSSANTNLILDNFQYTDNVVQAQKFIFKRSSNVQTVEFINSFVTVGINRDVGQSLFDSSGQFTYSGKIVNLSNSPTLGLSYCNFSGEYFVSDVTNGVSNSATESYDIISNGGKYSYLNTNYVASNTYAYKHKYNSIDFTKAVEETINVDTGTYAYVVNGINDWLIATNAVYAGSDNVKSLGLPSRRWTNIYTMNLIADGANISFTNLPTTAPTTAGIVWNDAGTLKIS